MISMSLIVVVLTILATAYAVPYANYEFKQKNKAGAIMIYLIATACVFTSITQLFI